MRTGTGSVVDRWHTLPRPARWVALVLIAVFFYALPDIAIPFIVTTETDWATTLFTVSYYVLLALGLNVVVGKAGLLDLGYVGFFALGAYTTALLASPDSDLGTNWSWLATVPIAVVVVMISGVLLGWPTLRLRGDYLAIVTLGFAEIIRVAATAWPTLRGQRGFGSIPHPPGEKAGGLPLFGVIDARPYYWLGLTVIIVVIFGVRNLDRSRVGRAWVAVREDEEAAEAMGVPTFRFKLWAFAIGAAIGSLSGVMFAGQQGFINSRNFDLFFSILVLAGVVMGGSGNIAGAILGGALIAYLPERLRGLTIAGQDAFEYRFLFFGLILVLVMIFRPQGLIPSRRRAQELKDREKEVVVGE
ncbi:branched-chain amino acid ABC transporter permease [Plantactinospora sp. GCM10030261]|uniref:branched-chain amino acid ABC transporter permease n=1 Tax=Plantactinospora sp. GCM10030261 TaxID=3273420 RepID=UPI003620FDF5